MATAGLILSIIGTALSVLIILGVVLAAVFGSSSATSSTSTALLRGAAHWV
jgi:hypothetical protein